MSVHFDQSLYGAFIGKEVTYIYSVVIKGEGSNAIILHLPLWAALQASGSRHL